MTTTMVTMCCSSTQSPSHSNSNFNSNSRAPPFPAIIGLNSTTHSSISIPPLSRRNAAALLLSLGGALFPSLPAIAFNFTFSGPKDWLKEQKKKSIKYLLAPIDASRDMLRSAYQLLLAQGSESEQKDLEEIQGLLRSAARDCVPEERNSLVEFQANTGVEVCTFKLVVKNASSLLNDNDPTKVEAEAFLSDLIRSFTLLSGVTKEANIHLVADREKIADALMDTLSSLDKFELGIKGCINV